MLALLLARGPEGSAEIVTVLAGQLAGLMAQVAPGDPEAAYERMVTEQAEFTRDLQRAKRILRATTSEFEPRVVLP